MVVNRANSRWTPRQIEPGPCGSPVARRPSDEAGDQGGAVGDGEDEEVAKHWTEPLGGGTLQRTFCRGADRSKVCERSLPWQRAPPILH